MYGKLYQTPFSAGTFIHYNIATACIHILTDYMQIEFRISCRHVASIAHAWTTNHRLHRVSQLSVRIIKPIWL